MGRLIPEEAPLAPPGTVQDVVDALVGLGPIERLLRQPEVTDVLVNGDGTVWVERRGELEPATVRFAGSGAVVAAVERTLAPLGLRLDQASPMVDARLADGSRLHAVIPPVAVDGPVVAVRRFTAAVPDLIALVDGGGVDEEGARQLAEAVADRRNLVVSGGTGAGKTTLLNVLSTEIPADERVVAVEDTAELRLAGHVVRLEARPANAEGAGAVTLQDLVRTALRLRPDRIIVGEVRGPGALGCRRSTPATTARCPRFTPTPPMRRYGVWRRWRSPGGEGPASRRCAASSLAGIDLVVQVAGVGAPGGSSRSPRWGPRAAWSAGDGDRPGGGGDVAVTGTAPGRPGDRPRHCGASARLGGSCRVGRLVGARLVERALHRRRRSLLPGGSGRRARAGHGLRASLGAAAARTPALDMRTTCRLATAGQPIERVATALRAALQGEAAAGAVRIASSTGARRPRSSIRWR